jgi:glycerol-3-phosphate dehydrogenase
MKREEMLRRVGTRTKRWDLVVIGGGATGAGIAVDAASRGYDVLLLERSDFGKGTSSRSTKLLHGGVRYLQQGNIPLVMEALRERGLLLENAPHLVSSLRFVVPAYEWWEKAYYGIGLKLYSLLAGKRNFGPTDILSRSETLQAVPNLRKQGLGGGVAYHDGQFDDARLLLTLIQTAADQGATVLNYAEVIGLRERLVTARDTLSGNEFSVEGRSVINATGPFCDSIRQLAEPDVRPIVAPSQGIHLVVDRSFLAGENAIMIPRTSDGRVMFAIPWQGYTLLGTTDTPIPAITEEPRALEAEIGFVLQTAGAYLQSSPDRTDVLSVFAGIRPLIRSNESKATAALARDHKIDIERSGLITITGGKWTTYRHMAELAVDKAADISGLGKRQCVTEGMRLHGYHDNGKEFGTLQRYGSDAPAVKALAASSKQLETRLHPELPYIAAEVVWSVRTEMAQTVEDVLARRLRALFLNAEAAIAMAPAVAGLMAEELGWSSDRAESDLGRFLAVARQYSCV